MTEVKISIHIYDKPKTEPFWFLAVCPLTPQTDTVITKNELTVLRSSDLILFIIINISGYYTHLMSPR